MHVVLVEPEIPPNTGNIARLCAATGTALHLIEPFGFRLDDATLRRAGLDYWQQVVWRRWANWPTFRAGLQPPDAPRQLWFVESEGPVRYDAARFGPEDCLVFGRETAGLPRAWLEADPAHWLRLPMFNRSVRSLNLANCVAVVLFEALRQQGFPGERGPVRGGPCGPEP